LIYIKNKKITARKLVLVKQQEQEERFIAHGGHAVILYEKSGQLRAKVEENLPPGFSRSIDLPVYKDKEYPLLSLQEKIYNQVHVCFPEKDLQGKGHVYTCIHMYT
jgi:hypothetical protein